ncbi:Sir2 family NAD+-dependent deacetylase [Pokkaliibacter sp. CJK22405]|uniref:Sir2 family NAD+-dependent deacetylase n=1 Tax=Pokkaliibacter sp. CJK22405 TaxID=3384615 RepID=UPI00398558AB
MVATLQRIVILTGAGISAESGIPTFRASDGLWENEPVEKVATPEGFQEDPSRVQEFYNARRAHLQRPDIHPNAAHQSLAQLAAAADIHLTLVTQNIDNLHERAGSDPVLHMHGELLKVRCTKSGHIFARETSLDSSELCPCCSLAGTLRPDIVWFGEMPMHMDEIYQALAEADLFVSIGTSGHVYPAAGFVQEAKHCGAKTLELNLEPSNNQHYFDDGRYGPASVIVPDWVNEILAESRVSKK